MCGIIGTFPSGPIDLGRLGHRGPDTAGIATLDEITLGQVRLSILDLTDHAFQPQWSPDGRVLLAFNGELYNYRPFAQPGETSDTAALAQWLSRQGAEADLASLDGMYAFAAWFPAEKRLLLARDPPGVKPLYVCFGQKDELAFCSEIKGFFGLEWFQARPNLDVHVQTEFLQYGYAIPKMVAVSWRGEESVLPLVPTLLDDVFQICPGQVLTLSMEGRIQSRMTRLPAQSGNPLILLEASVQAQSMADVEVGVQLSGGIDSSLVAHRYARTGHRVKGFYVSIEHPGLDEDIWAEHAARTIRTEGDFELHRIRADQEAFHRVLPDVVWHMDEPAFRHPNAAGVFLLCEHVRTHTDVKVLLTGEGADEIFGGYEWQDGRSLEGYDRTRRIFDFGDLEALLPYLTPPEGTEVLDQQLWFDRTLYLPPILARQDRMSMAHSIETRVPFLSNAFLGLPAPLVPGKGALKREAVRVFGDAFAYRKKCGFGFPLEWLEGVTSSSGSLDWLRVPHVAVTPFQRWSLAAMGLWSEAYLGGGWRSRSQAVRSQVVPAPAARAQAGAAPSTVLASQPSDSPYVTCQALGAEWLLDPAQYLDGEILNHGTFEPDSIRWLPEFVKPGMTVLDVGANFGFYAILMSRLVGPKGRVLAFEPSVRFRKRLENHVQRNHCNNIEILGYGLSNQSASMELFGGGDSATLWWHDDAIAPSHRETIQLYALDAVAPKLNLDSIGFVKIDIDGSEPLFLAGARETLLRHRPILLIEFMLIGLLKVGTDVIQLAASLSELGYLLCSEHSGVPWPSGAAFLREAMTCRESLNVIGLPVAAGDSRFVVQRHWLKELCALPPRRQECLKPNDSEVRSDPARPVSESIQKDTALTDRAYWDTDRTGAFTPWTVESSPYDRVFETHLPRGEGRTCAEIGAYPGAILTRLSKHLGYEPVAIEFSEHASHIAALLEHNGISRYRVIQNDFLEVKDEQFDLTCSFGFVEHFRDYPAIVRQHISLTRPGGHIAISVPRIDGFQGMLYRHTYRTKTWETIRDSHNPAIMNLGELTRLMALGGNEILFAGHLFGGSIYFPWTADFLRPDMRWLIRYLNMIHRGREEATPSHAFYSPNLMVIARRFSTQEPPEDPRRNGCLARAQSRFRGGDLVGATEDFQDCLRLDPGWHDARAGLGELLISQGAHGEALALLKAWAEPMPNASAVRLQLARVEMVQGHLEVAEAMLLELVSWDPYHGPTLVALSDLYRQQGRLELLEGLQAFQDEI
jgi:asparagine synthase (glutamine-hydrolysing)